AEVTTAKEELMTDTFGMIRNMDAYTFQALDPKEVEGKMCNPVYATGVGDDYRLLFLDATTNQVVMVQQPGLNPASGAPVTQKVYIDEYQEMSGFVQPKLIRITYDDEPFGKGTVEAFAANPKIDAAMFEK
ncbi:MAG: hypothetical protein ACI8S7_001399, partial [Candidatus Krumholzibacteriia bacterium]